MVAKGSSAQQAQSKQNKPEPGYRTVQMNLRPESLFQIQKLLGAFNAVNRTDVVKQSLNIAEFIVDELAKGDKILIGRNDGTKTEVIFPGIKVGK
jgi:hypothetical protein